MAPCGATMKMTNFRQALLVNKVFGLGYSLLSPRVVRLVFVFNCAAWVWQRAF